MAIRPEEIERKDFVPAMRGYERQEVDAFLRAVAEELREAHAARMAAEAALEAARSRPDNPIDVLSLEVGVVLKTAKAEAERMRSEAEADAAEVREQARQDALKMLEEARERRSQVMEDAQHRWDITCRAEKEVLSRVELIEAALAEVKEGLVPVPFHPALIQAS